MLVTGGQTRGVLREHHRQVMKAVTSEEAEFLPVYLCAAQLATLTTDSPSVCGDPETTESAQTTVQAPLLT